MRQVLDHQDHGNQIRLVNPFERLGINTRLGLVRFRLLVGANFHSPRHRAGATQEEDQEQERGQLHDQAPAPAHDGREQESRPEDEARHRDGLCDPHQAHPSRLAQMSELVCHDRGELVVAQDCEQGRRTGHPPKVRKRHGIGHRERQLENARRFHAHVLGDARRHPPEPVATGIRHAQNPKPRLPPPQQIGGQEHDPKRHRHGPRREPGRTKHDSRRSNGHKSPDHEQSRDEMVPSGARTHGESRHDSPDEGQRRANHTDPRRRDHHHEGCVPRPGVEVLKRDHRSHHKGSGNQKHAERPQPTAAPAQPSPFRP